MSPVLELRHLKTLVALAETGKSLQGGKMSESIPTGRFAPNTSPGGALRDRAF
jgi:hypothetical protein